MANNHCRIEYGMNYTLMASGEQGYSYCTRGAEGGQFQPAG